MLRLFTGSRLAVRGLAAAASAAEAPVKIDKESLAKLRKKTGYSYVNCRKALLQFGSDLAEAEKWLRQNAEKEGWAKAAKLSSRQTTQGLVGVKAAGKTAAIVELSCETDFVARGDPFKDLLRTLVDATLQHAEKTVASSGSTLQKQNFDVETVKSDDGKTLKEIVAMAVGRLGENISMRRVEAYYAPEGSVLYGGSHPKEGTDEYPMGRFVSVVAIARAPSAQFPTERLANQLCQHIIGMRSETLGTPAVQSKDTKKEEATTNIDAEETQLLRQAFMLNPSQTVYEYVTGHHAKVLDFARAELGGDSSE
ncbi:unnamed protein product, partial [Mesorhabditis spiculigera]